jgi:hypothetical protein
VVALPLAVEAARKLQSEDKVRLLTAFLAALALCVLLLLIVWACARLARRYMNSPPETVSTPLPEDEWRLKPLGGPPLDEPDGPAAETEDKGGGETGQARGGQDS